MEFVNLEEEAVKWRRMVEQQKQNSSGASHVSVGQQQQQPQPSNRDSNQSFTGRMRLLRQQVDKFMTDWNHMIGLQNELRSLRQTLIVIAESERDGARLRDPMLKEQIEYKIIAETEAIFNLAKSCIDVGHSLISNLAVIIDRVCSELNSTLQWSFFRPEEEHEQGENIGNAKQWCDQLLECILEVRGRIVNVAQQFSYPGEANKLMFQAKFQLLVRELESLYRKLLPHLLVVLEQPPDIVKKAIRLRADCVSVTLLCNKKYLRLEEGQLRIQMTVLNESQAKDLYALGNLTDDVKNFSRNVKHEMVSDSGGAIQFRNVIINDVDRRKPKTGFKSQGVLASQFCFLFYLSLKTLSGDTVQAWCCSRPFVLIVNENQIQEASGVALWNSLHDSPRIPFVMPEQVTWSRLAWALNRYIQQRTKDEDNKDKQVWNLTERNLRALGTKFFGHSDFSASSLVSSDKFLHRDGQRSFWDWFYQAVKLLKESNLAKYWNRGYIVGFVSRNEARSLVASFITRGTFLIRFCESCAGAIALSVCSSSSPHSSLVCKDVGPMNEVDLGRFGIEYRLTESHYRYVVHEGLDGMVLKTETAKVFRPKKEKREEKEYPGYVKQKIVVNSDFFDASPAQVSSTTASMEEDDVIVVSSTNSRASKSISITEKMSSNNDHVTVVSRISRNLANLARTASNAPPLPAKPRNQIQRVAVNELMGHGPARPISLLRLHYETPVSSAKTGEAVHVKQEEFL